MYHLVYVCSGVYSSKATLKRHKRTHSGDRSFKCNLSNKSFVQSMHLCEHLNVHTGDKPHKVDLCNRSFAHSVNLNRHLATHSIEKFYKCVANRLHEIHS